MGTNAVRLTAFLRALPFVRSRTVGSQTDERPGAAALALPSHVRATAVLEYTIRMQRRVGLFVGAVALTALGWQQYQIWNLSVALRNQDYIVVPGAVEFVRVRPNLVGDRAVLAFAEYFASHLVSVGYLDLEGRYRAMSEHMSPGLWSRMQTDLEDTLTLFRTIRASEVLQITNIEAERKALPSGEPGFVAVIEGQVERYAGDRRLEQRSEVITVVYRTSPLSQDDPWLFEVVDFIRQSPEEFRRAKLGRSNGGAP